MTRRDTRRRPLRIGIWLKYHVTLEASEGIGVFAHHLARGLANLPNGPQVVLAIHQGDEHVVQDTVALGKGRIEVAYEGGDVQATRKRPLGHRLVRLCRHAASQFTNYLDRRARKRPYLRGPQRACARLTGWLESHCNRLAGEQLPPDSTLQLMSKSDVWLVPYVGLDLKFPTPTVVTIHDLVPYHFEGVGTPEFVAMFKQIVPRVAGNATVAACMSEFIRENDLEGVLKLPKDKIRVVAPAVPRDFGELGNYEEACKEYPVLGKKYFLYPAAFRKYKNHEILVHAMNELRQAGDQTSQLVFTGIRETPPELRETIESLGLTDRVHVLGKVERRTLALFYRHAMATVVPSFYEQGSFPLMEALHWGCPVACSDIPALRECFGPLGESMRYFDPYEATDVARVLAELRDNQDTIRAAQGAAFKEMSERTWVDAARDWLEVFEYAIERYRDQLAVATASAA